MRFMLEEAHIQGGRAPSPTFPFHCWLLPRRWFVRHENVRTGPYTGGGREELSTPVSLLDVESRTFPSTTFSAGNPEFTNRAKDTRLANDYWQNGRNDRFWYSRFYRPGWYSRVAPTRILHFLVDKSGIPL